MEDFESNFLPRINSKEDTLSRINTLWKVSHERVLEETYSLWDMLLDRVWLELINLMSDAQFNALNPDLEKINKELYALGPLDDSKDNGFKKKKIEEYRNRTNQYNFLLKKETFLRKAQNKIENKRI